MRAIEDDDARDMVARSSEAMSRSADWPQLLSDSIVETHVLFQVDENAKMEKGVVICS